MGQDKLICSSETVFPGEFVICDSEKAVAAHQELFKFDSSSYIVCDRQPLDCLVSFEGDYHRLHIATSWEGMLSIALWRSPVSIDDTMSVLNNAGMSHFELAPFANGSPNDIFPVLYYGKSFDMLRKICNIAKRTAESRIKDEYIRIDCHLVSDDSDRIIASSL